MKHLEEIFNKHAKENMQVFNLAEFKKSHPCLLKSILLAMEECEKLTSGSKVNYSKNSGTY